MKTESIHPLPEQNHEKYRCICEMCNCGRHHCPPPKSKGIFETSYNNHYHHIPLVKNSNPQPQFHYQPRHYNPQSLKTNYQQNYIPQPSDIEIKTPSRQNIPAKMILYQVPFVGSTSYKQQYKPFTLEKTNINPQQIDPRRQLPAYKYVSPAKFEGLSSYKAQFTPPKVQSKVQPYGVSYQRLQVPFTGSSSYKNDFLEYKIIPQSQSPPDTMNPNHVKFQGNTSYHDQYQQYKHDSHIKHSKCQAQEIAIPTVNYINQHNHIYFDPKTKKLF